MTGRPPQLPDGPKLDGGRAHKLAKWLMHIPDRAAELRLIYRDSDGNDQVLHSWLREVVTPEETPGQICAAIQDHCDELEQHCRGVLAWLDGEGKTVTTKPWRGNPQYEAQKFTGDLTSMLQQNQRHIEALLQYNVRSQSLVVEQLVRVTELMATKLEDSEKVADVREEELDMLKEELRQLREQSADQQDPHTDRVMKLLEGAIGHGLAKHSGGN